MMTAFLQRNILVSPIRLGQELVGDDIYKDQIIPGHDVVGNRTRADAGGGIGLHALEVAHQPPPRRRRHFARACPADAERVDQALRPLRGRGGGVGFEVGDACEDGRVFDFRREGFTVCASSPFSIAFLPPTLGESSNLAASICCALKV